MVAISIEDQIDALEKAEGQLMRIMFSSGFNWFLIPECEEIFSFDDMNMFIEKLRKIQKKLKELKQRYDETD